MPIYEYECEIHGRFEHIQRVGDAAIVYCPICAKNSVSTPVVKVISAAAFHLKGSGWYKTDYAPSSGSKAVKSEPSGESINAGDNKASDTTTLSTTPSTSGSSSGSEGTPSNGGCGTACPCH